jgi:rubrerythrin
MKRSEAIDFFILGACALVTSFLLSQYVFTNTAYQREGLYRVFTDSLRGYRDYKSVMIYWPLFFLGMAAASHLQKVQTGSAIFVTAVLASLLGLVVTSAVLNREMSVSQFTVPSKIFHALVVAIVLWFLASVWKELTLWKAIMITAGLLALPVLLEIASSAYEGKVTFDGIKDFLVATPFLGINTFVLADRFFRKNWSARPVELPRGLQPVTEQATAPLETAEPSSRRARSGLKSSDWVQRLDKVRRLRAADLIDDDEQAAKKAALIAELEENGIDQSADDFLLELIPLLEAKILSKPDVERIKQSLSRPARSGRGGASHPPTNEFECTECGATVGADDTICPRCGGSLEEEEAGASDARDPNLPDAAGITPLMYAVIDGKLAAVRGMLANGGDPRIRDRTGTSAISYARSGGDRRILAMLQLAKERLDNPESPADFFCAECNSPVSDSDIKCPSCGRELGEPA